jgi:hypothetical protein
MEHLTRPTTERENELSGLVRRSVRRWEFKRRTRLSSGAEAQYHFSDSWRSTVLVQSRTRGVDPLRAAEGHRTLVASVDWATDASGDPFLAQ